MTFTLDKMRELALAQLIYINVNWFQFKSIVIVVALVETKAHGFLGLSAARPAFRRRPEGLALRGSQSDCLALKARHSWKFEI